MDSKYHIENNKVGYNKNSYEVRARKQGELVEKAYAHYKATGEMRPPGYRKPAPQLEPALDRAEELMKTFNNKP
jgi:hypothetical protein